MKVPESRGPGLVQVSAFMGANLLIQPDIQRKTRAPGVKTNVQGLFSGRQLKRAGSDKYSNDVVQVWKHAPSSN